jgi:hypothetical protein
MFVFFKHSNLPYLPVRTLIFWHFSQFYGAKVCNCVTFGLSFTDGRHDGDSKEQSFGEGPRVGPVVGGVVVVLSIAVYDVVCEHIHVIPDLRKEWILNESIFPGLATIKLWVN